MQDALVARAPADKLTDPEPDAAVAVPPQVLLRFGVEATTRPAGRLSVKARLVSARFVFGLAMVKVSEVVPFSGMLNAPKVFWTEGGVATVRFAEAVLPVPPFVEVTLPVVFVY